MEVRRLLSAAVLGYHNDAASTGQNLTETALTPANVNVGSFGRFYSVPVDGQVYAQPLYVPGVNVTAPGQSGIHNVVYVATEHDSLYAIDSDTGAVLWKDSFLVPDQNLVGAGNSVAVTTVSSTDVNTTDITPEIGITSTPAIDDAMQYLYVVPKTKQVVNSDTSHPHFVQTLDKVNIQDGTYVGTVIGDTQYDLSTGTATYTSGPSVNDPSGGAPDVIDLGSGWVTPFDALRELQRSAVTLYNGDVYLAFASHGDNRPYHGWILGFDQSTLTPTAVFCDTPDGAAGGIWMGGGKIAIDPQGYMYVETGNGSFDTTLNASGFPLHGNYSDSFIKLAVDATSGPGNQNVNGWGLKVVDYFTPYDQEFLSSADADLGSGAPLVLPDSAGGVQLGSDAHPHLLVGSGKEGKIYLIDRDHMGGFSPTTDNVVQELPALPSGSFDTPAFFFDGTTPRIYYGGIYDHIRSFDIAGAVLTTDTTTGDVFTSLCTTPSISANGTSNGIVWAVDVGSGQLRAYDAGNLGDELWSSAQAQGARDTLSKAVKFSVPTVADGHVFVGTFNSLVVYGVLAPPTSSPQAPAALTALAASGVQVNLTWTDESNNEDGFTVEASANGGATWNTAGTVGVNTTAYSVIGLTPGASYSFRVRAFNSVGPSDYSNVTSATTLVPPPVLNFAGGFAGVGSALTLNGFAPTVVGQNLILTDGKYSETSSVFSTSPVKVNYFTTTFSFQLSGDGEGFAFVIQADGSGAMGDGGPELGYGGMGFSAGVKFDMFNNSGEGSGSTGLFLNGASMADPGNSIRMTPAGVDILNGDVFQATLKYDGTTLVETVVDTVSHASFSTSYLVNIPSLVGGNTAYVGFTAATDALAATQSVLSWSYTPLPAPPNSPGGLVVEAASGTELDLSWAESGSTVDHFNVLRSDGTGGYSLIAQVPGSQTYYADGGLTPGGSYSYEVVASNLSGDSSVAGPVGGTTPVAPNAPLNFQATNITSASVTLTWSSGGGNATGYRLTRQLQSNNAQLIALLPPGATSYTDQLSTSGQAYEYVLSAYNLAGPSTGVAVHFQGLPTAPLNVTAVGGSASVLLNWSPATGASSYNIYRGLWSGGEGAGPVATGVNGTSYTDTGLLDGTIYYYFVTASDAAGESGASTEVTAQTFATNFLNVQAQLEGLTLKRDVDGQHVDWTVGQVSGQMAVDDPFGLTINSFGGNASITLDNSNGNPLPNIVHINGTFTISGLQGGNPLAGVTLDIGRSTVYINYGDPGADAAARAMVNGYVVNAFNGGTWDGAAGDTAGVITSLTAAGDPNHVSGIGWADSSDGTGVNTVPNTIELKYTLNGDTNLNGTVDIFDLNNLLPHFNATGDWTSGDFNYTGTVDIFDLNALLPNFNTNLASLANPRVSSPSNPITTNQTSFTIRGTSPSGSLVKVWLDANQDGVPDTSIPVAQVQLGPSENTYSITVNLISNTANHFLVTATDATGKQSATVPVPTITQDSVAPAAPSTPVLDPASDTGSSSTDDTTAVKTPVFTGTAEANSAITVYSDGVAVGSGITDGSGQWRVTVGGGDPAYSGMKLADGAHSITVRATDAAGNTSTASSALNVVIDTVAPTTAEAFGGAAGSNGWFTSTGSVTLIASDSGSGVAGMTYTLDGGSPTPYTAPFALAGDGIHSLVVTTTDVAGNIATQTFTIKIDTAVPAVSETYSGTAGSNGWFVSTGTDTITTADEVSGIASVKYVLDGGSAADYAGPFAVTGEGIHTIAVTVTDNAGNVTTDTQTIKVDAVKPSVSQSFSGTAGNNGWYVSGGNTTVTATDVTSGVAGVTWQLDGGPLNNYTVPFAVTGDGTHTVTVTVTDVAGNVATSSQTLTIDTVAPVTTDSLSGTLGNNGWYTSGSVGVSLSAADATSGVAATYYSVDGGAQQTYGGALSVSGEGSHSVTFYSVDSAGNMEMTGSDSFKIDGVNPITTDSLSGTLGANGWYTSSSVQVSLSATDATSGVAATYYSVDGGNPVAYSGVFSVSGDGNHTVGFFSVDKAGDVEATKSESIKIDSVAPTAVESFDGTAGSNGWFVSVGNDTITASDAASGVAGMTYSVDNGPVTAYTAPFAVTGDGTHTVSITVTDKAGNVSTDTQTIKIDATKPAIGEAFDGTAGNGGWFISGGNDSFTADDATSGVASVAYKFDGGASTAYAGPFAVGGDGTHTVVVTVSDNAGNVTIDSQTIKIDTVAPATTATLTGTVNANGWYTGSDVQVTLSGTDATSGVAATYYRVDGGNFSPDSGVFAVSGEGNHTVDFYSVDKAGNTGVTGSDSFKIESLATTAGLTGTLGANCWYTSSSVNVTLTATDAADGVAGTYYSVDGGAAQAYSGTFSVSGEGSHSISFHSVDNTGNIEPTESLSFKIDSLAPITTDSVSGTHGSPGWYTSSSVQVSLGATDPTSGVATTFYSLDGGAPLIYSGAFTVSGEGTHSVSFHSVDTAGNVEAAETDTIKIDSVKPTTIDSLSGTLGTEGWYTSSSVNVTLSAADAASGVAATYYSVDGANFLAYDGAFPVTGEGSHTVSLYSVDNAGNIESSHSDTFKIDSVKPATIDGLSGTLGSNGYFTSSSVGVTLTSSDATSGVAAMYYSVDGGSATPYTAPFTVSGEGSHTITFYSVDIAGNTEATESDTIRIDSVAPAAPSTPVLTAASDSGSSNSDGFTNVKRPTFTGTAEAGSTVTVRDGDIVLGTTTVAMDGSWSFTVSSDLADGVHSIAATATDAAGNTSVASGVLAVTIDTSLPVVTTGGAIAVASGTDWTGNIQSFTDSGPTGDVWTATVNYGDGTGEQVLVLNGNNYSLEHTWTNTGSDPGIYTVTVKVTDLAGNIGIATFLATISLA
jgi:hypothetical protein